MDYSAFHWAEKARKYAETIGTVFNVKGRVDTIQELPVSGNKVGDLWLVGLVTDPDLIEYAWLSFDNVTRWEKIGSTATAAAFSTLTGSPYDNTSLSQALNDKQDTIDDLATIRSKANTALQPLNITAGSYSLVDVSSSGLVTSGGTIMSNCLLSIANTLEISRVIISFEPNEYAIELESGAVITPNGKTGSTNKFNKVVISSSVIKSTFENDSKDEFLVYGNGTLYSASVDDSISGTTAPTNGLFYNTSTNIISLYKNGSQVATNLSVPLCVFSKESGVPKDVVKTFSGFSYLGGAIFSFDGVTGLIPNGRDSSGRLLVRQYTTTSSRVWAYSLSTNGTYNVILSSVNFGAVSETNCYFDVDKNDVVTGSGGSYSSLICGKLIVENSKIKDFIIKPIFFPVSTYELDNKQDVLVSGTNIKTVNGNSVLGSGDIDTHELPSQTSQSGKFLTTNGTTASWGAFDESDLVHKTGNETITGTKSFEATLQLKNNLSFRSYGSNDSGRLQFRAQPSDNVIRGTFAITDGYSTAGSGYNGYVAQFVAREGNTTSEPFNTLRVSNKGVEYIKEANDGTVTGQYIIVDPNGVVPSDRLASSGSTGQFLVKAATGQSWASLSSNDVTTALGYTPTDTDLSNLTATGKSTSANLAMPSGSYTNLTLGASGASYTAPDNGYLFMDGITTAQGGSAYIMANNMTIGDQNYLVSGPIWLIMPVKKGDSATVVYDSFTAYNFKFIYAQGEV